MVENLNGEFFWLCTILFSYTPYIPHRLLVHRLLWLMWMVRRRRSLAGAARLDAW